MQASKSSSEHFTAVGKLSAEVFTGQQPARGRRWLNEIVTGVATESKDCRARKMQCRKVARLAPDLVKAAIEDRLPRGLELPVSASPRPMVASVPDAETGSRPMRLRKIAGIRRTTGNLV